MPKQVTITPDVRAILERCTFEGNALTLPQGELDRKLYESVDKVLRALGGKWQRGQRIHAFPSPAEPLIAEALGNGVAVDQKRSLEQFFTPPEIAEQACDLAGVRVGEHVLEPSAGDGRLVSACLKRHAIITAVEIDEGLCLRALVPLAEEAHGSLNIFRDDFLEWRPVSPLPIDRVVMNPPFGNRADIVHVGRAYNFLRPGGRLVAIMSPHWTFAANRPSKDFGLWVRGLGGDWELLPEGAFKAEGTGIRAGILTIDKPE